MDSSGLLSHETPAPSSCRLQAWAKLDEGTGEYHHLAHHCADVATCVGELLALPVLRSRLESVAGVVLSEVVRQRLAVLGFLHDAGKLHPGFQAKGWPKGVWRRPVHSHVLEGAALFTEPLLRRLGELLGLEDLIAWGVDANLLFAALAHHGRPFGPIASRAAQLWEKVQTPNGEYDPAVEAGGMGSALRGWFPMAFSKGGDTLPAGSQLQHMFCGIVALADWLGSDKRFFPYQAKFDPGYIHRAREQARNTIRAVGLQVDSHRAAVAVGVSFEAVTRFATMNPAQSAMGSFSVGEQLVLLEAETGGGKTEAAFWRFTRLFEAGKVDGLYFALPTRSSAVQLHARINRMLKRLLGKNSPEAVLAVPGYIRAGKVEGEALPGWKVYWDDQGSVSDETLAARWAAESSKRYLAAMFSVGTVDQAMLAALQVKHAHLRGAALSRSLLVIDEVHASDSYMTEVQNNLLRIHRERGGYALLMSATLGSRARCRWLGQAVPSFEEAIAEPYPALWGGAGKSAVGIPAPERQKPVRMNLLCGMEAGPCASLALSAAREGARVLVVRNTVTAAVETWQAVQQMEGTSLLLQVAGGPVLHHGRFAPEDRKLLDQAVEEALTPKRSGGAGVIVIGTQTLEQSLDIDADLLITDLCPMDVLLQRVGRLHRHAGVMRPLGFEEPRCHVMTPANGLEPLLKPSFSNGLGAWREKGSTNGIYRDLAMLELTRRLVMERPVWTLPAMNRLLVESATHDERIEALHSELGKAWREYHNDVVGDRIANAGVARLVSLHTEIPFADPEALFVSDEEKVRTRLGAEGARIRFTEAIPGPFGVLIDNVTLPAHWSHGVDTLEPVPPHVEGGLIRLSVGDTVFSYSRSGLSKGS